MTGKCAGEQIYTNPISKPVYFIGDLVADFVTYLLGPITEEQHKAELDRLSQKAKEREDRTGLPGGILDKILDEAENLIKVEDIDNSDIPKTRVA